MARPRVDKTLGELARRRVDLSSPHFGLAFMPVPQGVCGTGDPLQSVQTVARFAVSAPKRHLKRAVDRNALKRVAREAWRLADWPPGCRPQVAMLKLRRTDPDWKTMGKSAIKKGWRAEIDGLVARLIRRVSASRLPAAGCGSPMPADGGAADPVPGAQTPAGDSR